MRRHDESLSDGKGPGCEAGVTLRRKERGHSRNKTERNGGGMEWRGTRSVRIELPNRTRLVLERIDRRVDLSPIFDLVSPWTGRRRGRREAKIGYHLCAGAPLVIPLTSVSAIRMRRRGARRSKHFQSGTGIFFEAACSDCLGFRGRR